MGTSDDAPEGDRERKATARNVRAMQRHLASSYPHLWHKIFVFTVLNFVLQSIPLIAGAISAFLLNRPFAADWTEALALVAFSWTALPSFLDRFPWTEPRRDRYALWSYSGGILLLFVTMATREVGRIADFVTPLLGDQPDATALIVRTAEATAFVQDICAPILLVATFVFLYWFLCWSHLRLLTKVGLRLRWHHQAQFAGFYVAKQKGIYEKAGLDVRIRDRDIKRPLINKIAGREDDFGVLMAPEVVRFVSEGRDLTGVEIFSLFPPLELLLNRARIEEKNKSQEPIRVLSVRHYVEDEIFKSVLPQWAGKFQIDYYSDNHGAQDFLNGTYEVIVVHRANEKIFLQRTMDAENWFAIEVINPLSLDLHLYGETLVTSAVFARDRPKLVEAMRRTSIAGWDAAKADPETAAKISLEFMKASDQVPDYEKPSAETIGHQKAMLGEMLHLYELGREYRGRQSEFIWQRVIDSCRKTGVIGKNANVEAWKIIGP